MLGILGKQPHLGCTRPKFGERYPVERIKMLGILVYTPYGLPKEQILKLKQKSMERCIERAKIFYQLILLFPYIELNIRYLIQP